MYSCYLGDPPIRAGVHAVAFRLENAHPTECTLTLERLQQEAFWAVSASYSATLREGSRVTLLVNGRLEGMLTPMLTP
jgi:hypothetical protein